jgi:cytochrome c-type biogenesis protein CcmH/NrfG
MSGHQFTHTLLVAGAVVVLAALALFAVADRQDVVAVQPEASPAQPNKSASVSLLIGGLEAKLVENPSDAKGWLLLARSYDHLGDNNNAWNAYERARELGVTDDTLELKLAANMVGKFAE